MTVTCTEKQCAGCLRVKPMWAYYKRSDTNDGYTGRCKTCMRLAAQTRRQADPEKTKEQNARYRSHHNYTKVRERTLSHGKDAE